MDLDQFKTKKDFIEYLKTVDFEKLPKPMQDELSMFIEKEAVEAARLSFYQYVMLMGPTRIDGFRPGRHIEVICNKLDELGNAIWGNTGLTPRKMISLPPGGMKSELCSRLWPSWLLGKWPHIRIIILGHGIDFARDEFGAKIRDIIRSSEYQRIFPNTVLRADKQTAGRFLTQNNGEVVCSSLGAKIAGRRGHVIITDDVIVEDEALSPEIRGKMVNDYPSNARSRLLMSPDGAELCVGTRWVPDDLFDFLEKTDAKSGSPWDIIKIPALLDEETSEKLRKPGDPENYLAIDTSFWPELHPTKRLEMLRASYAANMWRWNALYMQNPTAQEGQLLSAGDFLHWTNPKPPECHTIIVTADTAFTKQTYSDYTAYQVWGIFTRTDAAAEGNSLLKNHAILLDAKKGKWDFHELCPLFEDIYQNHRPDYFIIENRSSGIILIPELRKRGLPIYDWITDKDKISRMQAASPLVKSGIFWVPMPKEDPYSCQKSEEFIGEIISFPGGSHDDVPDAFSQFVLFARDNSLLLSDGIDQDQWGYAGDEEDYEDWEGSSYTASYFR